ncbi:MAG: SDR family oxidoreductase [Chitinophagaceae bacterium]|nr:SDR family oxidoreductase [Chitinophagaceae bacterium]
MKIGITGASGQLGRLVIQHVKSRTDATNLVALVRNPDKAKDLGIEARTFDYNKPEGLVDALAGIDTLLLISGSEVGQREVQHKNVVGAAQKAGVKRIVYTSLLRADTSGLSLAPEHLATEKAIKSSGILFTILRNGWYTENYTVSVPGALKAGAFIGSAGTGKIASAARNDYAEAAAVVLTEPGHEGKTYELAGDEAYTLTDLAATLSQLAHREIPYQNMKETDYARTLQEIGLPEGMAKAFAGYDTGASKGDLFSDDKTLSKLIKRPTTPLSEVIKIALFRD